jgi:phosphoenolpyruvate phosphomutase
MTGPGYPEQVFRGTHIMTKFKQLKSLLSSSELEFLCEAHNGLSAKIVEEAGFKGIWGSGLALSAQFGLRDNNEASWTQALEMLEFMSDATRIPILFDGDTGFGNFNNMRRLVVKLEQRGIAGVCIEDKLFPKANSFLCGESQPLADIDEFCGKIKAGKDAQANDDFCLVARVEAFIVGQGLAEALRRAEAYHAAGADGILIHSARSTPDEILAFKQAWGDRCPVVIVPTKYYATPTEVFSSYGISVVIWANHLLRSSLKAMQATADALFSEQNLLSTEDRVAPLSEVFRLQGADELERAEQLYLPRRMQETRAIVLAASRGKELGDLTLDRPKAMVEVSGRPLLSHIVDTYHQAGIKRIIVVRGYRKEAVDLPSIDYVDNDEFEDTGELFSLHRGLTLVEPRQDVVVSYGDVMFNKYIQQMLLDVDDDLAVTVDTNWQESANRYRHADYVIASMPHSRETFHTRVFLKRIVSSAPPSAVHGEWMGFLRIAADRVLEVTELVAELVADRDGKRQAKLPCLINRLIERGRPVRVLYTTGHWLDIDTVDDVVSAASF